MEELSLQDQEFVKEVALTNNQTQAVKKAYGITNDDYARVKGTRLIAKDNINMAVQEVKRTIAEQIPDDLLLKVHLEGLTAGKMVGETLEPDYAVRHKYLDTAHKLKGTYAPEKSFNLNLEASLTDPKARELAEKYEKELKKNL